MQSKPILLIILLNHFQRTDIHLLPRMPIPEINFDLKMAHFRLNTDSSVVKFPEIQYICTMTDFTYNMENRVLKYGAKGKIKYSSFASG